jgi:hypothetical protein
MRRTIFKWKKGFTTISLGLIYHSMVLSQLPSRDPVPLSYEYSKKNYNERKCRKGTQFDKRNV